MTLSENPENLSTSQAKVTPKKPLRKGKDRFSATQFPADVFNQSRSELEENYLAMRQALIGSNRSNGQYRSHINKLKLEIDRLEQALPSESQEVIKAFTAIRKELAEAINQDAVDAQFGAFNLGFRLRRLISLIKKILAMNIEDLANPKSANKPYKKETVANVQRDLHENG
jgi:hypothetical protein